MATEQTRNAIWQEFLDVARLVRYYEALSDRQRRNRAIVQFLLLAAAASGIAALLDLLPSIVQAAAGGLVALLVAWDFVSNYAKKAAVLHAISIECSALEIEWRDLWFALDTLSDEDAHRENTRLARRLTSVTGWAGQADIREDRKLNEQCAVAAYKVMAEQYAV